MGIGARDTATNKPVSKVQQALIDRHLDVGPTGADGVYGGKTAAAVRAFKKVEHLGFEEFGDVGKGTMRRLNELFPPPATKPPDTTPPTPVPPAPPPPATTPPAFRNPGIQSIYERHKATSTPAQDEALHLLDRPRTGPWSRLDWDLVAIDAAIRVYQPEHIRQDVLGLCGPAAAMQYDAATNARHYAQEVVDVFEQGKAGGKSVNKTLLGNAPPPTMSPCDWMLLSAIQDVTNYIGDYHGTEAEDEQMFGSGLNVGQQESVLKKFAGCVKTAFYSCAYWGVHAESMKVNALLATWGNDVVVIMLVDSTTLEDESKRGRRDHAIRLLRPMTYGANEVSFDAYTWGANRSYKFRTKNFEHMVSGYVVGARRNEIPL